MSRARYLKPGFFTNERVGALPPIARLAWQGLWGQADREGRLKDRPATLKIQILPFDLVDFNELLEILSDAGFIERYAVCGERYIWLPSFKEHQSPHVKEPASLLPAPDKPGASPVQAPAASRRLPGGLPPESELITESESDWEQPPAAVAVPHRRAKQEFRPLSDEQRKAIETEFRSTPAVSEEIDRALAHEAARKSTDMNLYVRGWLRRQRPPPVTSSKPNMMPEFRREPP